MAVTIPDITVSPTEYVDVNTLSGIAAGIALIISNKSTSSMLVQIAASQPDADSGDGELLGTNSYTSTSIKLISSGESTVWAKSLGFVDCPLSVQDNT